MSQITFECAADCGLSVSADTDKTDASMILEVLMSTFGNHEHGQKVVFHNGVPGVAMIVTATVDQTKLITDLVTPEPQI